MKGDAVYYLSGGERNCDPDEMRSLLIALRMAIFRYGRETKFDGDRFYEEAKELTRHSRPTSWKAVFGDTEITLTIKPAPKLEKPVKVTKGDTWEIQL